MKNKILYIIFDLGGIIININYHNTRLAFEQLGIVDFDCRYNQLKQSAIFDAFETGKLAEEEFISYFKQLLPKGITDLHIINAWNAMLMDIPRERLETLSTLKKKYKTFLLSNTNIIHERAFHEQLKLITNYENFNPYFKEVFLSHQIGKRKPDKEAFIHILDKQELNPKQTLFIDDSPQHIEGAASLGIHTLLIDSNSGFESKLKAFLNT